MEQNDRQEASPASPKKWVRRTVAVAVAAAIAALAFLAGWLGSWYARDARLRKLAWLIGTLDENYYQDVDLDALYDALYAEVVPDMFSYYYSAPEYEQRISQSEGQNEGVGVSLITQTDGIRLYSVAENSPACLAGLKEGMYLLGWSAVGGEIATGGSADLMSFIAEQQGEFVLYASFSADDAPDEANGYTVRKAAYLAAYCLYRDSESTFAFRGDDETILTDVTEEEGALPSLGAETAYIRLDGFDGNCAEEFAACLARMKERGRTNLIIDLRGNGGGYLRDLQSIASHLLRNAEGRSPVVARAVYRSGAETLYRAAGNDFSDHFTQESKIAVLADENSASASECLIGALVDYGTIGYGDIYIRSDQTTGECRTYGKGVMQSTFVASDGSAFRLTVAEIFWPNGKSIHGTGVTPADGAVAVSAPALPGETDEFLRQAIELFNS